MRVVHVNYDGAMTGGASIAMLRIHHAMLSVGIDSIVVCATLPKDEKAIAVPMSWWCKVLQFCVKCTMKLAFGTIFPTGLIPTGRVKRINGLRPDAVILHWLQSDTLSVREISKIEAPVFYMHHDMWPSLGLRTYTVQGIYGRNRWLSKMLDDFVLKRKRVIYSRLLNKLHPAATNEWVSGEIHRLGTFGPVPVAVVPYPLSDVFMKAFKKLQKRTMNEKFTILNGSNFGYCEGVKGGDRLVAALSLIPREERENMVVRIFGGDFGPHEMSGVQVEYLGRFDEAGLVPIYYQADVFAFPSRKETFGQTKIESLACGAPVVAFNETACAIGIQHKVSGWVAPENDVASFAEGIRWIYQQWLGGTPLRVQKAVEEYAPDKIADKWLDEFKRIGV